MSRGHGRIERLILDQLKHNRRLSLSGDTLAEGCCEEFPRPAGYAPSAALRSSVNRALRNLCRQGLVYEFTRMGSNKYWAPDDRLKKQAAKERKEERRRSQDRFREETEKQWRAWREINVPNKQRRDERAKAREQLKKILGMLGSDHDGEALSAARRAEEIRRKFGETWDDLLS